MAAPGQPAARAPRTGSEAWLWLPAGAALLITTACVLWPALVVVIRIIAGPGGNSAGETGVAGLSLLLNTFLYSGGIAALAVVLAWPAAWVLRAARPVHIALIGAPLFGPAYLAYAGWGILRSEGTFLGGVIARADPAWHAPTIAWHANAIVGLVLWVWPLAAFTLSIALRRIPDDALDMLRLDARSWRQGVRERIAMARTGLVWAFALVFLVMLGSAVPLHVAQVRTWAIHVWTVLATSEDRWRAWAAGWPLLAVAIIAAWLIARRLREVDATDEPAALTPRAGAAHVAGTALLWSLSVVAPILLFLWSVKPVYDSGGGLIQSRPQRLAHVAAGFLRESQHAIANSAANAAVVGLLGALVGLGVWTAASARGAGLSITARWTTRSLLIMGLVPGVLVGLAIHQAWDQPTFTRPVGDSPAIFVLAHLARFGFLGAIVGWLLAAVEPAAQRDARALDGATGLSGFAKTCLAQSWPILAGAAVATAALSLHEIEAAIWVQRPGEPFLARQMLDDLHYARDDRLAVGVITMMLGGLLLGFLGAWLLGSSLPGRSGHVRGAYRSARPGS